MFYLLKGFHQLLSSTSPLAFLLLPYQYGLTKETKFLSTTDLYCLLLSRICCSPPVKSKQDLPRAPSHVGHCLAPLPACQEKVLRGICSPTHPGLLPSADATPPLLPEAPLSPPEKKKRRLPSPLPDFCHYLKPTCWVWDGVLHHVHSWRRVAVLFFYFF